MKQLKKHKPSFESLKSKKKAGVSCSSPNGGCNELAVKRSFPEEVRIADISVVSSKVVREIFDNIEAEEKFK